MSQVSLTIDGENERAAEVVEKTMLAMVRYINSRLALARPGRGLCGDWYKHVCPALGI
jgi:hypothetical protein